MKEVLLKVGDVGGAALTKKLVSSGIPHALVAGIVSLALTGVVHLKFKMDLATCELVIQRINARAYSFDFHKEKMFIDINRWYMDVRVY